MTIPFSQPYTAPDGSTRRPLWERCRDTRPYCVSGYENVALAMDALSEESDAAALALSRVAVEDWLREDSSITLFPQDKNDPKTGHFLELDGHLPEEDRRAFTGPSMAHALNAAAHAVLDAKGVAP